MPVERIANEAALHGPSRDFQQHVVFASTRVGSASVLFGRELGACGLAPGECVFLCNVLELSNTN